MRLSTGPNRDDARSIAVIHAALDAGVTLLDTSDAYARDDADAGHNERLIAKALSTWTGGRGTITVATKGGLKRPKGAWVNDGRAKHLREACEASLRALGVESIDLYQLHAVDPKTPIETSVRALAALRDEGKVRAVGLCNVTVGDIRTAQAIVDIAAVQVSLSPFDDESLRNGVAEYCRDNGIRLIAYRPLGGVERVKKLAKDKTLAAIAAKHSVSVEQIVLAWLMSFRADVVPIPGATRIETARSLERVPSIVLDDDDRHALDERFSGRALRVPRHTRRPPDAADGDVVVVMGMPGAGKTTAVQEFTDRGYERLNRDEIGGSLADLLPALDALIAQGQRQVVLDNTYPTRKQRNEVIEAAWARGVPVRCIWLTTTVADAQINCIQRMVDVHGSLPSPEEIRQRGKSDTRYLGPDAQFRYERTLEPPTMDEGFVSIESREFFRAASVHPHRAVILDFDALRHVAIRQTVLRHREEGWLVFAHAWRPNIARGQSTASDVAEEIEAMRAVLGVDVDVSVCPHDAGPPMCWCRKPIPGSVLEFASKRRVGLGRSIVVAMSAADRTMGERLGATVVSAEEFVR